MVKSSAGQYQEANVNSRFTYVVIVEVINGSLLLRRRNSTYDNCPALRRLF